MSGLTVSSELGEKTSFSWADITNTWQANAPHKKDFYPAGGPRAHFDSSTNYTPCLELHFFQPLVQTALRMSKKTERIFQLW